LQASEGYPQAQESVDAAAWAAYARQKCDDWQQGSWRSIVLQKHDMILAGGNNHLFAR